MQDRTYSDLLTLIRSLAGAGSFTDQEQASILSFVNRRASEAYSMSQSWPRYLGVSDERYICNYSITGITGGHAGGVNGGYALLGKFDSTETTAGVVGSNIYISVGTYNPNGPQGTVIFQNNQGAAIVARSDVTLSKVGNNYIIADEDDLGTLVFSSDDGSVDDLASVTAWEIAQGHGTGGYPYIEDVQVVPYSQYGKADISEPIRIHKSRSFRNNSSLEYDFYVDFNGMNILNLSPKTSATAYVTYNKELGQFTDQSTDIPSEWFAFMAHASYADFLRLDGQAEKAIAEEQVAQKYISMELEKVDNVSNRNTALKKFSTYTSRQAR